MSTIPPNDACERLRELSEAYAAKGGDYLAQSSWWDAKNWSRHIHPGWNLPNPITRHEVFRLVKEGKTVESAEKAFVAVMLWGYGQTGYGPHRVDEMKSSGPEGLGHYMLNIVNAAGDSPVGAYGLMAKYLAKKLGPSYASKVAYFVTHDEGPPTLVSGIASSGSRRGSR